MNIYGNNGANALNGTSQKDYIAGRGGNDTLYGGGGNDQLMGGEGQDFLSGGNGADWLNGGPGFDVLQGEQGNDTLIGGPGQDQLIGGAGRDVFLYTSVMDSYSPFFDWIMDFEAGLDKIDLSRIDANVHRAGNQAFFLAKALTGVAGQLVITAVDGPNGSFLVEADTNGDSYNDYFVSVQLANPGRMLSVSDFIL